MVKYTLILGVILLLFIFSCTDAVRMKSEADAAREVQDSILRSFKTIDKDLQKSNSTFDSLNKELKKKMQIKL